MLSEIRYVVLFKRYKPWFSLTHTVLLQEVCLRKQWCTNKKKRKNLMKALGANTENQAEWQV